MLRYIITTTVSLFLVGCMATPTKTPVELKASSTAQILGLQNFDALKIITRIGANIQIGIEFVDGRSYFELWSGFAYAVEVAPGRHTVHVVCNGTVDGVSVTGESVVLVHAEPGKIYQLFQDENVAACSPEVVDVTSQY